MHEDTKLNQNYCEKHSFFAVAILLLVYCFSCKGESQDLHASPISTFVVDMDHFFDELFMRSRKENLSAINIGT